MTAASGLFPAIVYGLCFTTSAACSLLLYRSFRRSRDGMLFWSAMCFLFLAINNLIVIVDLLFLPAWDLRLFRLCASLTAVALIVFGFVWRSEDQ